MAVDKRPIYFTPAEYLATLKRQRDLVAREGYEFFEYDDTTPGNKHTECSHGLCSRNPELWPDPEMHLWPEEFTLRTRIAPKYFAKGQFCPFDERAYYARDGMAHLDVPMDAAYLTTIDTLGCFYHCLVFKHRIGGATLTDIAPKLYDNLIAVFTPFEGEDLWKEQAPLT